jgi:T-complex protein 1 subunit theta
MGLPISQITLGYEMGCKKAIELLEKELEVFKVKDISNQEEIKKAIKSSLTAKYLGNEDLFCNLVSEACLKALPRNPNNFDSEFIRIQKILGGNINDSYVINGLVVNRNVEGSINDFVKPKVAVYSCPLDPDNADTKGTVLIKNADDLLNYTKGEEDHCEKIVKEIVESGVNVVVGGGSINDVMMHYFEKHKVMVVKVLSKFELRRLCKCVGAIALTRLGAPVAEEMGQCDRVHV